MLPPLEMKEDPDYPQTKVLFDSQRVTYRINGEKQLLTRDIFKVLKSNLPSDGRLHCYFLVLIYNLSILYGWYHHG